MKPVVLDCSLTLSWCFEDESSAECDNALNYISKNGAVVPNLWLLELTNGLLSAVKLKRLSLEDALKFLELISRLPIQVASFSGLEVFTEVFKLAQLRKLSAYDAGYLFLALREKKSLITLDKDLLRAAKQTGVPTTLPNTEL